jgi:hypothetical protein
MAQISPQLLENEWITHNGLKNFLKDKKLSFGDEMNRKYAFKDDRLLELADWDAFNYIKENHVVEKPKNYK